MLFRSDLVGAVEAGRATRFNSANEIYWCVASILGCAPFVRTIWIVTDEVR